MPKKEESEFNPDIFDEAEIHTIRVSQINQDLDLIRDTVKKGAVKTLDITDALKVFAWAHDAKTNLKKISKLKDVI